MFNPLFSINRFLEADVITQEGVRAGGLYDLVGHHQDGNFTYLIVRGPDITSLYAIHHSYFRFNVEERIITFDESKGQVSDDVFPELPDCYDDSPVYTCAEFVDTVLPTLEPAHHRTDEE